MLTLASAAIIAAAAVNTGSETLEKAEIKDKNHKQELRMKETTKFITEIKNLLLNKTALTEEEENILAAGLSEHFGLNLKATLEGNRLNEIYGYFGAEQHLYRWKGDTLSQHGPLQRAGIAPLQGAFKDFDNAEQEKFYIAAQLHELPNWNTEWPTLKPWYKYRKVFVFNPTNQKGVVAVIGDAGPAKWTGKTFGGSPEVMEYLEMVDGAKKSKAIVLFVDDPENKIALGPADAGDIKNTLAQN